ncbi:MAG: class I SAM-dependent methyltransferase [Chloroflexi bacterium]|nr:class I SAM-dependent methyltransferase [Chloroflexota bacterium]
MVEAETFLETADIETSSDEYARRFQGDVGKWFLSIQEEATLRMLAPYPGATILDLGGGHGQLTKALVQRQFDVTVAGSSEACKARIHSFVERDLAKFDVVDFLNLPYNDRSFGVVISYRLLPHLKYWRQFVAEMTRVAEKCVIIDYPNKRSINYFGPQFFKLKRQLEGNSTRQFTCFTEKELLDEFRLQHFGSPEQYAEFFLPMVLHRTMKMAGVSNVLERSSRMLGLTARFGSPRIMKLIRQQPARSR